MSKKVKPYVYPDLSESNKSPELAAKERLTALRKLEGGTINNITSIDTIARILTDYFADKINE